METPQMRLSLPSIAASIPEAEMDENSQINVFPMYRECG